MLPRNDNEKNRLCERKRSDLPEFPCHRERKRGDPLEKVRGIYSVLYSDGLPRSLLPSSTIKANALQKPDGF